MHIAQALPLCVAPAEAAQGGAEAFQPRLLLVSGEGVRQDTAAQAMVWLEKGKAAEQRHTRARRFLYG